MGCAAAGAGQLGFADGWPHIIGSITVRSPFYVAQDRHDSTVIGVEGERR